MILVWSYYCPISPTLLLTLLKRIQNNGHPLHWLVAILVFAQITPFQGAMSLESRTDFDRLAEQGYLLGTQQIYEVKILVTRVQSDSPQLYFINSCAFDYHWRFNQEALKTNMDLYDFRAGAYTDTSRQLIAGSLIRYDSFSSATYPSGVYCIEFWA